MLYKKSFNILILSVLFYLYSLSGYSAENSGITSLRQTSKAFASVAKKVSPSVVLIQVESVKKIP